MSSDREWKQVGTVRVWEKVPAESSAAASGAGAVFGGAIIWIILIALCMKGCS